MIRQQGCSCPVTDFMSVQLASGDFEIKEICKGVCDAAQEREVKESRKRQYFKVVKGRKAAETSRSNFIVQCRKEQEEA